MATKLNKNIVSKIANGLREVVKQQYAPQNSASLEIEYAFHAALLIVDDATRYQSQERRRESFQRAADMFAQIAQTDYIQVISHIKTDFPSTEIRD